MTRENMSIEQVKIDWNEAEPGGIRPEYVLKTTLNRILYLQEQVPCRENTEIIYHLRQALLWEEIRNSARADQGVTGTNAIHN